MTALQDILCFLFALFPSKNNYESDIVLSEDKLSNWTFLFYF